MRPQLVWFLGIVEFALATQVDYSQYVNPLIGSEGPKPRSGYGGGDIFVGAARPFGMARVGIDTTATDWDTSVLNGGWTPDGNVTAITMMHVSGTGGAPKYGFIPQMPLTSVTPPVNVLDNMTYCQPRNGVQAELSGSRHAGIIQYSFPSGEKHVLVDLSHYIPGSGSCQVYIGGELQIEDNGRAYKGYGMYAGGWNRGPPFMVYFYGEFSTPPSDFRTFKGPNTDPMANYHNLTNGRTSQPEFGTSNVTSGPMNDRIGGLFSWENGQAAQISSRIGISTISIERARGYVSSEIPSWKLEDAVNSAVDEWNADVFSKIRVPLDNTVNITHVRLLYSALYFIHLMPSDRTDENPLWQSDEPYWEDFYTMWDIFRCTVSFYHIFQPERYESMIRAIIDIWRHEGFMPDGRAGDWNGLVQGGSDAGNVLADAYVKGLRGAINWTDGYAAMKKDAEVLPYNNNDPQDLTGSTKEGRGALNDWLELGYVSQDRNSRCISKTSEYSQNDFALSQVAAGEEPGDYKKYLERSAGWHKIWDPNVTSLNYTGFLAPRLSNGSFNASLYDPLYCQGCEWSDITYEGIPWEYSFVVPHDMKSLIDFMGGANTFESRLDLMSKPNMSVQDLGENGAGITTLMNTGNEPDFAIPYLYNYLNKQAKSVQTSRALAYQYFRDAAYGIPGNSDAGAMNTWLVWQILGIYPIVTKPVYLISSPWFPDLNMTINENQTLRITASDLEQGYYVQGVKINGQRWTKNWFEHKDVFERGGTIEFELGSGARAWETGDVPPSPGHFTV